MNDSRKSTTDTPKKDGTSVKPRKGGRKKGTKKDTAHQLIKSKNSFLPIAPMPTLPTPVFVKELSIYQDVILTSDPIPRLKSIYFQEICKRWVDKYRNTPPERKFNILELIFEELVEGKCRFVEQVQDSPGEYLVIVGRSPKIFQKIDRHLSELYKSPPYLPLQQQHQIVMQKETAASSRDAVPGSTTKHVPTLCSPSPVTFINVQDTAAAHKTKPTNANNEADTAVTAKHDQKLSANQGIDNKHQWFVYQQGVESTAFYRNVSALNPRPIYNGNFNNDPLDPKAHATQTGAEIDHELLWWVYEQGAFGDVPPPPPPPPTTLKPKTSADSRYLFDNQKSLFDASDPMSSINESSAPKQDQQYFPIPPAANQAQLSLEPTELSAMQSTAGFPLLPPPPLLRLSSPSNSLQNALDISPRSNADVSLSHSTQASVIIDDLELTDLPSKSTAGKRSAKSKSKKRSAESNTPGKKKAKRKSAKDDTETSNDRISTLEEMVSVLNSNSEKLVQQFERYKDYVRTLVDQNTTLRQQVWQYHTRMSSVLCENTDFRRRIEVLEQQQSFELSHRSDDEDGHDNNNQEKIYRQTDRTYSEVATHRKLTRTCGLVSAVAKGR